MRDGLLDLVVQRVQRADRVLGQLPLTLAEDADDHRRSPWVGGSAARSAGRRRGLVLALGGRRLVLSRPASPAGRRRAGPRWPGPRRPGRPRSRPSSGPARSPRRRSRPAARARRVMSSLAVPVGSSSAPLASSSSIAPARACICCGLVLGPLDGQADVAHLLADPGEGLVDPGLRLGGGVGRLDRLLAGAEGVDLGLQPLAGPGELLLLTLQLRVLGLQVGDLLLQAGAAGQRLAGQVLATDLEGLLGLLGQLVGLGVQLVGLQLDPLAAGRDVGDPAADLLQQLELPLVGVVEGLRADPPACPGPCRSWRGRSGRCVERCQPCRLSGSFPHVPGRRPPAAHRHPPYRCRETGHTSSSG